MSQLNKMVAHLLETDKDIASFSAICRSTHDAIDGDLFSFWRTKFRETYAFKEGRPNLQLRKEYQYRSKNLGRGVGLDFSRLGRGNSEMRVMKVLRALIKGRCHDANA